MITITKFVFPSDDCFVLLEGVTKFTNTQKTEIQKYRNEIELRMSAVGYLCRS